MIALNDVADEELLDDTRNGHDDAFAELYRRHGDAAESYARSLLRSRQDAEDAVAEAFAGILAALRNQAGPRDSFRPYLLACVRNNCARKCRRPADGAVFVDGAVGSHDGTGQERVIEHHLVSTAFAALNPRWRTVLWMTEVEQREPAEIAATIGVDSAAVSAALYRAREGFAESYLAQHVHRASETTCSRYAPKLARYVRGTAGDMTRRQVDDHLERCPGCAASVRDLVDVNNSLRCPLAPMLIAAASMRGTTAAGTSMVAAGASAAGTSTVAAGATSAGTSTVIAGATVGWLAKVAVIAIALTVPVAISAGANRTATVAGSAPARATVAFDTAARSSAPATSSGDGPGRAADGVASTPAAGSPAAAPPAPAPLDHLDPAPAVPTTTPSVATPAPGTLLAPVDTTMAAPVSTLPTGTPDPTADVQITVLDAEPTVVGASIGVGAVGVEAEVAIGAGSPIVNVSVEITVPTVPVVTVSTVPVVTVPVTVPITVPVTVPITVPATVPVIVTTTVVTTSPTVTTTCVRLVTLPVCA